jgi:hypothetical protein
MCSIRSISDARIGIPWMGLGACGKAAFMLVRKVSVRLVMVFKWSVVFVSVKQDC